MNVVDAAWLEDYTYAQTVQMIAASIRLGKKFISKLERHFRWQPGQTDES